MRSFCLPVDKTAQITLFLSHNAPLSTQQRHTSHCPPQPLPNLSWNLPGDLPEPGPNRVFWDLNRVFWDPNRVFWGFGLGSREKPSSSLPAMPLGRGFRWRKLLGCEWVVTLRVMLSCLFAFCCWRAAWEWGGGRQQRLAEPNPSLDHCGALARPCSRIRS